MVVTAPIIIGIVFPLPLELRRAFTCQMSQEKKEAGQVSLISEGTEL